MTSKKRHHSKNYRDVANSHEKSQENENEKKKRDKLELRRHNRYRRKLKRPLCVVEIHIKKKNK